MTKPSLKVCIVGGGNASHALAALLPFKGYETTMFCPYKDQAEQIQKGIQEQGGYMLAKFANHNNPAGDVKGAPIKVSKCAQDVIPDADLIIMPMPSFAYPIILESIKDHLKEGQVVAVTPGQGGFDWFAKDILGMDLLCKITLCGIMPMPFNCRITEYAKEVQVQQLKTHYSIGVSNPSQLDRCIAMVQQVLGAETVKPAGTGSFLECTLYPINAVLHPARLRTLLQDYKEGDVLPENPYFYEDMTAEATKLTDDINQELVNIGQGLCDHDIAVEVPHIFDWLAVYVYNEPSSSNLQQFFQTSSAYKGFKCPLVAQDGGFVPDFENRYFTEDINLGLCGYKGLADICGVQTPVITEIITWAQTHMKKEFLVDGKLTGKDIGETDAPQRFGIVTVDDLKQLYVSS